MDGTNFQPALEDECAAFLTKAGVDAFVVLLYFRLSSLCPAASLPNNYHAPYLWRDLEEFISIFYIYFSF